MVQGLFIEAILTAQLIMAIFMLAVEKSKATYISPIGIGIAFFICEMVGVYYTGGSLNPARTLGPAVVTGLFTSYHWIYWIGPLIGAVVATGFYMLLKYLEYYTVLPDQDSDIAIYKGHLGDMETGKASTKPPSNEVPSSKLDRSGSTSPTFTPRRRASSGFSNYSSATLDEMKVQL